MEVQNKHRMETKSYQNEDEGTKRCRRWVAKKGGLSVDGRWDEETGSEVDGTRHVTSVQNTWPDPDIEAKKKNPPTI